MCCQFFINNYYFFRHHVREGEDGDYHAADVEHKEQDILCGTWGCGTWRDMEFEGSGDDRDEVGALPIVNYYYFS